jgi:hypothetical protein
MQSCMLQHVAAVLKRTLHSGDSSLRGAGASSSMPASSIPLDVQRLKDAALLQSSSEARALALQ